ncbi:unnamed protein product [Phytomonas sp. EM1]|nr:unnamed protein product [Phytomonas sp. EM1]|eukprot:CCW62889.1 unnamed protein product [Phytomonas sp. isolate EM1]
MWRICQFHAQNFLQKHVFRFNALLLLFLTVQSSGFVLLSTYVQQRKSVVTGKVKSFTASHFLMCVECTKLLLSLFWSVLDVRRKIREGDIFKVPIDTTGCEVIVHDSPSPQSTLHEPAQQSERSERMAMASSLKSNIDVKTDITSQLGDDMLGKHLAVYKLQNSSPHYSLLNFWSEYLREVSLFQNNFEGFIMLPPAVWYGVQNYFILNAFRMLDPVTFQLFSQMRIPIIAFVMYIFLGIHLNSQRWLAIVVLFVGVILAQISALNNAKRSPESAPKMNSTTGTSGNGSGMDTNYEHYIMGIASVVIACTLSSISSVYMEWIFKKRSHRCLLSVRNVHLAFFSILYFISLGVNECLINRANQSGDSVMESDESYSFVWSFIRSYFTGFDYLVVILVLFHACRGIMVALVMRYSDNIMKSFSIGASILLNGVGSTILFDSQFTFLFLLASILVIVSIFMYNSA